ncbi:hypothetical protein [Actinophytocola glycyrrhizae]|uniref:YtxH domain-containing protein n=1 Tax=Actinophytocola glycyrrhizae TaxID=2044873 RepID=A0ABV9SA32_9PSEU
MTGFKVKPDYLQDAANKLDGLARTITNAKDTLSSKGDLPTLDPLSKAMAVAGMLLGGIPLGPLVGIAGRFGGKAISGAHDPYPEIRAAWLSALPRYARLLARDADQLRKSGDDYWRQDHAGGNRFRGIDPTYPMPRVPAGPVAPMPRRRGGGPVPTMPTPKPGPIGNEPI